MKEMKKVVNKLGGFYGTSKSRELQMCTHFVVSTIDTTIHDNGTSSIKRMILKAGSAQIIFLLYNIK